MTTTEVNDHHSLPVMAGTPKKIGGLRLNQHAGGSAQPLVTQTTLKRLTFRVPSQPVRTKLAAVLRAIDDFIENNRRRVGILEHMVRAIYQEWFIHVRYPGHEDLPLVDSPLGPIPGGWRTASIGDIAEVRYGQTLPKKSIVSGPIPVYGAAKVIGFHAHWNVTEPTIIMGCRGTCGQVAITESPAFVTNNSFTIVPKDFAAQGWLFHTLQARGVQEFVAGSAQPQITLNSIAGLELVKPPPDVVARFQATTQPVAALATALRRGATGLASIRDLLLPRLVTGQIDVSHLDLDALAEAAIG